MTTLTKALHHPKKLHNLEKMQKIADKTWFLYMNTLKMSPEGKTFYFILCPWYINKVDILVRRSVGAVCY
jgi:hypothetical protein